MAAQTGPGNGLLTGRQAVDLREQSSYPTRALGFVLARSVRHEHIAQIAQLQDAGRGHAAWLFVRPPKNVILTVDRLRKRFALGDAPAVERASFELGQGEMLALLGPSGCGKTTTLRMIAGFEVPDAGHVRLRGQDITHTAPEARGIGFVFQDYALFPHLTVLDNVKFGLRNLTRAKATARAEEMLRMVGLAGLAARRPHELSGGQQQRVALARTLAMAPPLVLMDEPFSNLDAAMRVETRQEVRKLLKQTGAAGIIVTHDQEEAMAVADRIAVMEAGRIVQIGTPDEIYRYPVSAFVASFIGRSNILNGKADGMEVATEFGKLPLSRGGQWGGHAVGAARTDHAGSGPGWLCLCGWARISRA